MEYDRTMMRNAQCRLAWALALAAAGLAAGCDGGENVSVGALPRTLDLSVCAGSATECDPVSPEVPTTPASRNAKRCTGEVGSELEVDFELRLDQMSCNGDPTCQLDLKEFGVASDDSVWVLGLEWYPLDKLRNESRIWLGHFAGDGAVLGTALITEAARGWAEASLAVSGDRASVLIMTEAEGTRLEQYEGAVVRASAPWNLEPLEEGQIARAPDGGLVITGKSLGSQVGAPSHVLARLDDAGEVTWSQTSVTTERLEDVLMGASQNTALLTARTRGEGLQVTVYDENGNFGWEQALEQNGEVEYPKMGADDQGNLTVAWRHSPGAAIRPIPNNPGTIVEEDTWLQRLTPRGDAGPLWVLYGNANVGMAVASSGRVFAVSVEGDEDPDSRAGYIYDLAADGESCQKHGYAGLAYVNYLTTSTSGQLYFLSAFSVGRFQAIAD